MEWWKMVNRTIIQIASNICKGDGSKWANHVGELEYAINTRVNSVMGYSPYELVLGGSHLIRYTPT